MKQILTFALCLCIGSSFGQQSTRLSQYMFNPMLVNTAASGYEGHWAIAGGFKSMWNSVPGAPKTQFLSVDGISKNEKWGFGGQLINDQAGLLTQRLVLGNLNYRFRLTQTTWLSAGVGLGFKQHVIDGTQSTFENAGDAAIATLYMSHFSPATTWGIFLYNRNTKIGLSSENVIQYKIDYTDVDRAITSKAVTRFYLIAQQRFPISENLAFIPAVSFKFEYKNPVQLDLTPMLSIQDKFRFGLGYRYDESVSLIVQNQINRNFSIGYAYDFQTNGLSSVTNGSHELQLRYAFIKERPTFINPRTF